jgi:hypothetical protein
MTDDINEIAQNLRAHKVAEQAELRRQALEAEARRAATQQKESEVRRLCELFHRWATRHRVEMSPSYHRRLKGWRLAPMERRGGVLI